MNTLDNSYHMLLETIVEHGSVKKDRTGTGTMSIFGYTFRYDMNEGFPLLTTKKMAWRQIVTELIWFLRGETNIKWLVDNNCYIWNGDAYKNYLTKGKPTNNSFFKVVKEESDEHDHAEHFTKEEFINKIKTDAEFAKVWGELGPIYGKQWRDWGGRDITSFSFKELEANNYQQHIKGVDQIQNLINKLKTNPDDRRMMVSAWNVEEVEKAVLPPCHYGFQCWTRELTESERFAHYYNQSESKLGLNHDRISQEMDQMNVPKRAVSLMWNQRSVDTFLGLPFNIASYGLLLQILAKAANMVPENLFASLGDTHIYLNHVDQVKEQLSKTGFDLPSVEISDEPFKLATNEDGTFSVDTLVNNLTFDSFKLVNYQSEIQIAAPLSN